MFKGLQNEDPFFYLIFSILNPKIFYSYFPISFYRNLT